MTTYLSFTDFKKITDSSSLHRLSASEEEDCCIRGLKRRRRRNKRCVKNLPLIISSLLLFSLVILGENERRSDCCGQRRPTKMKAVATSSSFLCLFSCRRSRQVMEWSWRCCCWQKVCHFRILASTCGKLLNCVIFGLCPALPRTPRIALPVTLFALSHCLPTPLSRHLSLFRPLLFFPQQLPGKTSYPSSACWNERLPKHVSHSHSPSTQSLFFASGKEEKKDGRREGGETFFHFGAGRSFRSSLLSSPLFEIERERERKNSNRSGKMTADFLLLHYPSLFFFLLCPRNLTGTIDASIRRGGGRERKVSQFFFFFAVGLKRERYYM